MEFKGSIEDIIFRNEENGYTILVLDVDGQPLTCVGSFPPVAEGEFLCVKGEMTNHSKYGKQFKVSEVAGTKPTGVEAMTRYLAGGLIKGIGPVTAAAIVSRFGEDTISVIEKSPDSLARVKGISKEKARKISEQFGSLKEMQDTLLFLQEKKLTISLSMKIYKVYEGGTRAIITTNPYKLVEDIPGIGFQKADKIAKEVGILKDSSFRISAGILHALTVAGDKSGNTYLPYGELIGDAASILGISQDLVKDAIEPLIISGKLKRVKNGLMHSKTHRAEKGAATRLVELVERSNQVLYDCDKLIEEFERAEKITLHETQKEAVKSATTSGVSVITGGPGTGKTTIIKCILRVLDSLNKSYTLLAPTGRAAKKMSLATGKDASTIHRKLNINPNNDLPAEKITTDVVIVDEVSMVDVYLLHRLLSSIIDGTKVIFVGDKDQLPSVGAGNVLSDIIFSEYIPVIYLTQIYRQAQISLIVTNAHKINNGENPVLSNDPTKDFFFIEESDTSKIANTILGLVSERLPKFLKCSSKSIQVLCPMKNGEAGTINLNSLLSEKLNQNNRSFLFDGEQKLKAGDRVMHTVNNYDLEWTRTGGYLNAVDAAYHSHNSHVGTAALGVSKSNGQRDGEGAVPYEKGEGIFNGDMGIVQNIRHESGEMDVLFEDGRLATYTPDIRHQLTLSYSITIHKSQGSEFDAVIIPIVTYNPIMMTRNLLYTAITRAKKMVVLIGKEDNIKKMTRNNYIAKRHSMLNDFIIQTKDKFTLLYESKR
ncbi:MAG: AAA family ATPase [Firmicutes bacterium]|nr:AAA family ATPase [Bacillota bacterium]